MHSGPHRSALNPLHNHLVLAPRIHILLVTEISGSCGLPSVLGNMPGNKCINLLVPNGRARWRRDQ